MDYCLYTVPFRLCLFSFSCVERKRNIYISSTDTEDIICCSGLTIQLNKRIHRVSLSVLYRESGDSFCSLDRKQKGRDSLSVSRQRVEIIFCRCKDRKKVALCLYVLSIEKESLCVGEIYSILSTKEKRIGRV